MKKVNKHSHKHEHEHSSHHKGMRIRDHKAGISCPHCLLQPTKWYKDRLVQVLIAIGVLVIVHYVLELLGYPLLHDVLVSFYDYVSMIWFPILLGILIGGIIDYFVPREYVMSLLARHDKKTILYSIGLGFLASACSHGVLAISMELYRKGASTPAIIAFLLASPWANLSITIILFGFFGYKALFFIAAALLIALTTGLAYLYLDAKGLVECKNHATPHTGLSIMSDIRLRLRRVELTLHSMYRAVIGILRGSWELSRMILWWMIIGMLLASLVRAYVPSGFFVNYMGPRLLGLIITLVFATIIEVCSEGTAPLAFEIFRQTGAFGNSFVFLMAGVVTDYTEIGLIWSNIGKRAALYLPLITVPQVVIIGYIFNMLL